MTKHHTLQYAFVTIRSAVIYSSNVFIYVHKEITDQLQISLCSGHHRLVTSSHGPVFIVFNLCAYIHLNVTCVTTKGGGG